jgi:hypothetical protein
MKCEHVDVFRRLRFASIASVLVVLTACIYLPFGFTPIKKIVDNPALFENKQVKVKGTVTSITKIPFMEMKFYVLSEGTNEIPVVTNGVLPAMDNKVTVVGIVENVAIIGNQSMGLHIREEKRIKTP